MTFKDEKNGYVNVPSVMDDGRVVDQKEAFAAYQKTGHHLGKFNTLKAALNAAQNLHEEQAADYDRMASQNQPTVGPPNPIRTAVGAPSVPGGPAPLMDGVQMVPFSEFYKAIGGDRAKAEEMVPGITKPDGHKLLKPGPDGKPHVSVKPEHMPIIKAADPQNVKQTNDLVTKAFKAAQEHKQTRQLAEKAMKVSGQPVPKYMLPDEVAQSLGFKSWAKMAERPGLIAALYPGGNANGGASAYLVRSANGVQMIMNPHSPDFQKMRNDILKRGEQQVTHEEQLASAGGKDGQQ